MHIYIPDEYVPQILNIDDTGQKLYEDYVAEIISGDLSLWAPVKKRKEPDVHVWQQEAHSQGSGQDCGSKGNQRFVWALDGPCSFEQRHLPEAGSHTYEFTLTPRSLFAPDGSVLPCSDKTKLIHALENMVTIDTDHAHQQEQLDESTHSTTSRADNC